MQTQTIVKLLSAGLISLLFTGCGGDNAKAVLDGYDQNGSHFDDFVDGATNSNGKGGYLDCTALDPDKVYLVGVISPNNSETEVLVNLDNPGEYCIGLTGTEANRIVISESGTAIIAPESESGNNFATNLVQDSFTTIPAGNKSEWEWPSNITINDTQVAELFTDSYSLFLKQDGSKSPELYYGDDNEEIGSPVYSSKTGETPYYSNPSSLLLMGVMADGSLLMYKDSDLFIVNPTFEVTQLEIPNNSQYLYERTSRTFINADGHPAVWVLAQDTNFRNERRLSIDLETLTVTDDGLFASVPDYVDPRITEKTDDTPLRGTYKKLDGQGNLVQLAYYKSQPPGTTNDFTRDLYDSLIIKRPIASSSEESKILHSDVEYDGTYSWRQENWPVAHVFSGRLVTGQ